jgi:hypothetical protein
LGLGGGQGPPSLHVGPPLFTSMGALHTSPVAYQSPPPNGGSTLSVGSASVGMITIV